jgi:hypothetical protein
MPLVTIMLENQRVFVHQDSLDNYAIVKLMNVYHHHVYMMEIVPIKSITIHAIVQILFMKEQIAKYVCIEVYLSEKINFIVLNLSTT